MNFILKVSDIMEVPYAAGAAATLFWVDRESVRPADGLVSILQLTAPLLHKEHAMMTV